MQPPRFNPPTKAAKAGMVKVTLGDVTLSRLAVAGELLYKGWIELRIGDQVTVLHWKKRPDLDADVAAKAGRVLYAGDPGGLLNVEAKIVESDAEERAFLTGLAGFLKAGGTLAGLMPGYGTAVSAGLGLFSQLAMFAASKNRDDMDMHCFGSFGKLADGGADRKVPTGPCSFVRERDGGTTDLSIGLNVEPIAASSEQKDHEIVLVIDAIELSMDATAIDNDDQVVLEIKAGGDAKREPFRAVAEATAAQGFERFVALEGAVAYRGPWGGALSVSASISIQPIEDPKSEQQATLKEVVELAGGVATAIDPELKDEVELAVKVAQPVSEMIAAINPQTKASIADSTVAIELNQPIELELDGLSEHSATIKARLLDTGKKWKKPAAASQSAPTSHPARARSAG
ncbi:MAG: hypothetical protein AAFY08_12940 [Planctomycetota bacterium]